MIRTTGSVLESDQFDHGAALVKARVKDILATRKEEITKGTA